MDVHTRLFQKSQTSNKSKSLKSKYIAKKVEIDESLFGTYLLSQASEQKNQNYNHPEIGVLREDDLVRMKVYNVFIDRKPFVNQPKKNCNKKGVWLRKRKNTNYRWQKLNAKKCFDSKKRKRRERIRKQRANSGYKGKFFALTMYRKN